MKKVYILLLFSIAFLPVSAATYFWIGGTAGNWSAAANWSNTSAGVPAAFAPGANDSVTFDNGLTVSVNYDLAANDIGFSSFTVINNTQLVLENTVAATRSLTINNASSTYFEVVAAGSSLTLKSNTNNVFSFGSDLLSSGWMVFNGDVRCINQAINTTGGPRLNAQDSIIINKLFYVGPAIASGSNPTGMNKFRISSGATYQLDKNGGVVIGGKWEPGSLIRVTGSVSEFPLVWLGTPVYGGIEFDTPAANSAGISNIGLPANTVFQGDFKITNLGTSGGILLASNPTNVTIQGDLIINDGLLMLSNGSSNAIITVNGNLEQSTGTTLNLQGSSANTVLEIGGAIISTGVMTETGTSTDSGIELNGSSLQTIIMAGPVNNDFSLTINNSSGVRVNSILHLAGGLNAKLNFQAGNLDVKTNGVFVLVGNPSQNAITGADISKHVIGQLKRNSNTIGLYTFPVSDVAGEFALATISTQSADSTEWSVEFIRSNPNNGIGLPPGINMISNYRWDIYREVNSRPGTLASDAASINLKYFQITNNGIITPTSIRVVRWNGVSAWNDLGGLYDGAGGITTVTTPITSFGSFSLGGPLGVLPVRIEYLNGYRNEDANQISWKVNCTQALFVNMTLERSGDGRNYQSIYQLQADGLRCLQAFQFTDVQSLSGRNYYRLKVTDADGRITYSTVLVLLQKGSSIALVGVYPNPVVDQVSLQISSDRKVKLVWQLIDPNGRKLMKQAITVQPGNTVLPINIEQYPTGTYRIVAYENGQLINTVSFVKY
jgi:hypothetical protein